LLLITFHYRFPHPKELSQCDNDSALAVIDLSKQSVSDTPNESATVQTFILNCFSFSFQLFIIHFICQQRSN